MSDHLKCQKVYFDATILQKNDIKHLNILFPNTEHIILEAENIYTSKINVKNFQSLQKLDLIVTPSDDYPTLLSGKIDEEEEGAQNQFKILFTEEQEKNLEVKVDLSNFFSHELTYLLWHFGTKY